jgi:predicted butyrate kinase (DUF1464 family)
VARVLRELRGELLDKGRVEALLRQSILTDNFYFDTKSKAFTNVYPVEEHLMEDMVDSFHNLGQDMLTVLRSMHGTGESVLETEETNSFKRAASGASVVQSLEAMLLKTAQVQ